jgi:hypothetical protein
MLLAIPRCIDGSIFLKTFAYKRSKLFSLMF